MRVFRSVSYRLAGAYTALFALTVVALGAVTIVATRGALQRELDQRIQAEALALVQEYRSEGLSGVVDAIRERDRTPGALDYGLKDRDGKPLAGRLVGGPTPDGWSSLRLVEDGGRDIDEIRVLTLPIAGDHRLLVGENLERVTVLDALVLRAFALAFVCVIVLGVGSGFALSRQVQHRFGEMSAAAQAIIDGELSRRIPVRGSGDDLDALAATLNRMLDRISALMDSLRQVSNDVAHDLRTPLTRLRQRLEASLAEKHPRERDAAVEAAMADLDTILDTFGALLRIAQIEGGARRAAFRPVALEKIAAEVVEAFEPSADEGGRALVLVIQARAVIEGDRELLIQLLVNLVENGLRHTPPGSRIIVSIGIGPEGPVLAVRDNGPGVPAKDRERVLHRFVRLERSRSTAGSGLGLAMASAIARLHDARLDLADAGPGLAVTITFPEAAP